MSAREMAYPREATLKAIWEIKNIEVTEVKADAVDVHPQTPTKGTYRVRGRFAGVLWWGEFAYELNEGGFHSRTAGVPPDQATVEGGFVVTPIAGGCTVIHYEQYVLAPWLRPIKPVVWMYLRWSMRRELRDLEALMRRRSGLAIGRLRPDPSRDPRKGSAPHPSGLLHDRQVSVDAHRTTVGGPKRGAP